MWHTSTTLRGKSEVLKRGWGTEGVGARRFLPCKRFRPLFCLHPLFSCAQVSERGHHSGETYSLPNVWPCFVANRLPLSTPFCAPPDSRGFSLLWLGLDRPRTRSMSMKGGSVNISPTWRVPTTCHAINSCFCELSLGNRDKRESTQESRKNENPKNFFPRMIWQMSKVTTALSCFGSGHSPHAC